MDWTWYLFRFDGRINRALLWQALLIVMLLACMLGMIDQAIKVLNGASTFAFNLKLDFDFGIDDIFNAVDPRAYRLLASTDRAPLILKVLGTSLFLWIYLATAIKRLHDRDRSGWWLVPFFVVPALFDQFSDLLPTESNWFVALAWIIHVPWFWGLVEMFCIPGTSGHNRFGPDPLADIEGSSAAPTAKSWDQSSELEIVPPSASPPGGMHVKRGA
ncbi:DUF805 domain-containing protein [Bradyrhizobium xenonodulans]|uniref:DUF805 domain-containing protein n=1 Tax=Bradyrhizobium xenonodulans TaxID=2736875 RepID=A0ABY7MJ92_9BRAD|nr:DUF805 domain-containing protein [Bradyrhizobium xenonodulans]WBL78471.1 DUF805 domain-containing protein [Bradyrhizobium xenonodulans]